MISKYIVLYKKEDIPSRKLLETIEYANRSLIVYPGNYIFPDRLSYYGWLYSQWKLGNRFKIVKDRKPITLYKGVLVDYEKRNTI